MGCPSDCSKTLTAVNPLNFFRGINGFIPPVYVFVDENGTEFSDPSLAVVVAKVTQFRFENKLPEIPYLSYIVETFTLGSSDAYIAFRESYIFNSPHNVSIESYIKGAALYIKGALFGVDLVSQSVAEARGSVCLNCPYNVPIYDSKTKDSPSLAQSKFCSLRGSNRVSMEGGLNICGKCSCHLGCKVWFPKKLINESLTQAMATEFSKSILGLNGKPMVCWIGDPSVE